MSEEEPREHAPDEAHDVAAPSTSTPTSTSPPALARWAPVILAALVAAVAAFAIGRCTAGDDAPETATTPAAEGATWTCSMHPQIRQPEPGQCPICGMDLIPVTADDDADLAPNQVALSERARALAEIQTTVVRRLDAGGAAVRLLGRVDYDETALQTVTPWTAGRIDRLHVETTGARVRRGQIVATIYSPEVYAAQQDLITAKRQLDRLASASELARTAAQAAYGSARQRLGLLGIPDAEVDRMADARAPSRHVAIRANAAGTVIERLATEGAYVQVGTPLYRIADLGQLWVQLDAYESDLPHLTEGQTVELEVAGVAGEVFEGRVSFIDPVVDRQRRTARVRVSVPNPEGRLRPGMFVEAIVRGSGAEGAAQPLVIPATAPLFTGRRSVVYVEVPDRPRPTYEARVVRLGARVGDLYPVVAGLSAGERVVTRGAFAIDADLQIRGGDSMMTSGDDTTAGPYEHALEGPLPESFTAGLRTVVGAYLSMQQRLAADDLAGATEAARALSRAVDALAPTEPARLVEAWRPMAASLKMHAQRAADAADLEAARGPFEPLSAQIAQALRVFGNPMETPLRLARCPMAFDNRGAQWIQEAETIDNAYFGAAMLTCGSVEEVVEPGSFLPADPRAAPPDLAPASSDAPAAPDAPRRRRATPTDRAPSGAAPAPPAPDPHAGHGGH